MPCLNMQQDQTAAPLISRQVTHMGLDLTLNISTPTAVNDLARAVFSTRSASTSKPTHFLKLCQNYLLLLLPNLCPEPHLWGVY